MSRRAKIGGTLGPACDAPAELARLIEAGLDVARINFSHGSAEDHRRRAARLARAARRAGRSVALLADLQGPRFRVGDLDGGELVLEPGEAVELVAGRSRSEPGTVPVSYAALGRDVRRGSAVLIDDGKIALRVERVRGSRVRCAVERGGILRDHKGINLPGCRLSVPALTRKDRSDLRAAVALGADWLAVSFVRRGADVRAARRLLEREGSDLPVMAKIERPEAIDALDEILDASDGLLVARGDLGVELPAERVPILQKEIIDAANAAGKPVMTATQMLDSMRTARRPTRAEASDVANAVLDGSDSLLLTAETAVGRFPVEAIETMARIIVQAEGAGRTRTAPLPRGALSISLTACRAACRAAFDVDARCLAVFTTSGFSAWQTARCRPATPILAFTPSAAVARRLGPVWGVQPRVVRPAKTVEALMRTLDRELLRHGPARAGEVVVVVSGQPIGVSGSTNLVKLHRVGERAGR